MQATWAIHASRILRYDVTMKMSLSTYCFSVVPWSVVRDWTTRWPQMYSWCLLEFMIISFAVACDNSLQVAFLRLESRHKLSSCEVLWIGSDRSCIYVKFVSPGHTARTLLERSLSGGEKGQNFGNAHHRAQNGKQNRKHGRCLSGAPLRPALL